jgi:hypothetical protein
MEMELKIDFNESSNEKETNTDSDLSGLKHSSSNSVCIPSSNLFEDNEMDYNKPTFFFNEKKSVVNQLSQ